MMAGVATWEYRYGTGLSGMLDEMRASLSALGSVGWEVCGFASMDKTVGFNEYVVWLKRETLALTAPADTAPAWLEDPTGRNARRYWDGLRWTEHVEHDGTTDIDAPTR